MEFFVLTKTGLANTATIKLKKLFLYFLYCDQNQSNMYDISCYKYITYKYGRDRQRCAKEVKDGLLKTLRPHFNDVMVDVTPTNDISFTLQVDIDVADDNGNSRLSIDVNYDASNVIKEIDRMKRIVQNMKKGKN